MTVAATGQTLQSTHFPTITFPDRLSQATREEVEHLIAQLEGYLRATGLTASGRFSLARADEIDVTTLTAEHATIENLTADGVLTGLFTGNVVASYLRLNPSKTYAVSANDVSAFTTTSDDPTVSLWFATSSADRTINGIFVENLTTGRPGHINVIVNNSIYVHTYTTGVVTNARRLYGCTPSVAVPSGGVIVFIYDGTNLGWRFVASSIQSGAGAIPIGGGCDFYGSVLPSNFIWADGSVYAEAGTYAGLFAAIGTAFNTGGEGAGNFRVPDKRDRQSIGKGATYPTLGAVVGAATHSHTNPATGAPSGAETVSLTGNTGAGASHDHQIQYTLGNDHPGGGGGQYVESIDNSDNVTTENSHTHGVGTLAGSTGATHTHNQADTGSASNLHTSLVCNYILRYQ